MIMKGINIMAEITTGLAAGAVTIGFSLPYVAKYDATTGTPVYSDGMKLARGVSVSLDPETSDSNKFHADNQAAEDAGGTFTGGTATITVDGLLGAAEKLIYGLPDADKNDGWQHYGDDAKAPYVAIAYVVKKMSNGNTFYVANVLTKTKASTPSESADTQEDEIDWQTQDIEFNLFRDDTENHDWKLKGKNYTTEAEAEADIKKLFNISDAEAISNQSTKSSKAAAD